MSPPAVDPRRPGLVWPVAIDAAGVTGPTRAQARSSFWWRPTRGLYLPVGLDPRLEVDQRIVTAAALLPAGGAVTGWGALRWLGTRYLDGTAHGRVLPVPLAIPHGAIRGREGIELSDAAHLMSDLREIDGLTITSPLAAAAFEVCRAATLTDAVGMIDRVAAADLASLDELRAYADDVIAGHRWVSRLRTALGFADENCWSPQETAMRMIWLALGIDRIVCNRPVFDLDGNFLGTPDLLDVEAGVAGEYDGAFHLAGRQRAKDIRREGIFRRAGLEYVEMVGGDLADSTDFQRRTLDARQRARAGNARGWTIDPPPWWTPTHTVDLRRALSPWERERFLRWQAS